VSEGNACNQLGYLDDYMAGRHAVLPWGANWHRKTRSQGNKVAEVLRPDMRSIYFSSLKDCNFFLSFYHCYGVCKRTQ